MTPVTTKLDFYTRLRAGEFGVNDNHRWYDVAQWLRDKPWHRLDWNVKTVTQYVQGNQYYHWPVWGLQSIGKPGSRCDYNVPTIEVPERLLTWPVPRYVISPMMPDDWLVCQGEAWETDLGRIYLHSSTAKIPMRQALKTNPEHREGLLAKEYLRAVLPYEDFEDMMSLFARYPGHVIEFSVYGCDVGTMKRRTVWWEIRQY